jgi:hypothetical protein
MKKYLLLIIFFDRVHTAVLLSKKALFALSKEGFLNITQSKYYNSNP